VRACLSWTHSRAYKCSCIIRSSKESKLISLGNYKNLISNRMRISPRYCSNNHSNPLRRCIPYKTLMIQSIRLVDTPDRTCNPTSLLHIWFLHLQIEKPREVLFLNHIRLHSKQLSFSCILSESTSDSCLSTTRITAVSWGKEAVDHTGNNRKSCSNLPNLVHTSSSSKANKECIPPNWVTVHNCEALSLAPSSHSRIPYSNLHDKAISRTKRENYCKHKFAT